MSPQRDLPFTTIAQCLKLTIRKVLQGQTWRSVFEKNGFGDAEHIRVSLLERLRWSNPPHIPSSLPLLEEFQSCFPRGRYVPFDAMFSNILQGVATVSDTDVCGPPPSSTESRSPSPFEPWSKRLRVRKTRIVVATSSSSTAASPLSVVGAASSSSAWPPPPPPAAPPRLRSLPFLPAAARFPPRARSHKSLSLRPAAPQAPPEAQSS